jgi:hypothetical protein
MGQAHSKSKNNMTTTIIADREEKHTQRCQPHNHKNKGIRSFQLVGLASLLEKMT